MIALRQVTQRLGARVDVPFSAQHQAAQFHGMLFVFGLMLLATGMAFPVELENLPLLTPDVTAYQASSLNPTGLNGDGGWFLHEGDLGRRPCF